jgi:AcrR family transcriptional regulator
MSHGGVRSEVPRRDRVVHGHEAPRTSRQRILEAAYLVIERDGATGLTLDAVAAEAEVSKGGLLYHFPSKEALVSAMMVGLCEAFGAAASEAAEADPEPVGRTVRAYLAASAGEVGRSRRWLALVGALALYPELVDIWRADVLAGLVADEEEGIDPAAAAIVRLTADGLWLSGVLGLSEVVADVRPQVLKRLEEMSRSRS